MNSNWGYSPKMLNSGQKLSRVTLKFDKWPSESRGYLLYNTPSFVQHSKASGEFKVELQCGNAQFVSSSAFFVLCDLEIWWMTLKTIGHIFYGTLSFVHHSVAISEIKLELQSGNDQYRSKSAIFCAVKGPIPVNIDAFYVPSRATLKFNTWPWKTIGYLF